MTSARWIGAAALSASIVLSALGQLGMKAGMQNLKLAREAGEIAWSAASTPPLRDALFFTTTGLVAYGLSLLALSYVLVYAGATQWPALAEAATPQRTIGTLLILAGVALASLTGGRASH